MFYSCAGWRSVGPVMGAATLLLAAGFLMGQAPPEHFRSIEHQRDFHLSIPILLCCAVIPGLLLLGLWLWAIIDCLQREFKGNEKIIWVLVIVLLNWIGAIIYLLIGRSQGTRPGSSAGASDTPPGPPPAGG